MQLYELLCSSFLSPAVTQQSKHRIYHGAVAQRNLDCLAVYLSSMTIVVQSLIHWTMSPAMSLIGPSFPVRKFKAMKRECLGSTVVGTKKLDPVGSDSCLGSGR